MAVSCSTRPIALAFTGSIHSGHFSACVGVEGSPLALPLAHFASGELLPLRYAPAEADSLDGWRRHAAASLELFWWEDPQRLDPLLGGGAYPLAVVCREAAEPHMLMLPTVLAMRERFSAASAAGPAPAPAKAAAGWC